MVLLVTPSYMGLPVSQKMLPVTEGEELFVLYMPPVNVAEFPANVHRAIAGEAASLYMPPPLQPAVLPLKVQFATVGEDSSLYMPPPRRAVFPENAHRDTSNVELYRLHIAPPLLLPAELPVKLHVVTLGEEA